MLTTAYVKGKLDKLIGKKYKEAGRTDYQCVGGAKRGIKELYGGMLKTFNGLAILGWNSGSPFSKGRKRVLNGPKDVPNPGDVIFFQLKAKAGDPKETGHVAIVVEATAKTVTVFEQNGGMGSTSGEGEDAFRYHTYNYLKPKCLGRFHYEG